MRSPEQAKRLFCSPSHKPQDLVRAMEVSCAIALTAVTFRLTEAILITVLASARFLTQGEMLASFLSIDYFLKIFCPFPSVFLVGWLVGW